MRDIIQNTIGRSVRPPSGPDAPDFFGGFSLAASDYFARLDAAGLRVTTYDSANARLIDRLVSNGGNFWPDSGVFCAMAGYLYPGNGANLIPLKDGHDAGTLNAFVTGDWNAVTGLKGDGITKYVDSNRNNNADGEDDQAIGAYVQEAPSSGGFAALIGIGGNTVSGSSALQQRNNDGSQFYASRDSSSLITSTELLGLHAVSRSTAGSKTAYTNGDSQNISKASQTPTAGNLFVFATNSTGTASGLQLARQPFYHIGPNLSGAGELAELDAALTEWQNALASA